MISKQNEKADLTTVTKTQHNSSQQGIGAVEGILLVDKPRGITSFSLVSRLRRRLGVRKIGHAGTLDPFATGVMVMLVGRQYTRLADKFLTEDKEYRARIRLGVSTDSYDCDGAEVARSELVPAVDEVETAIAQFQGKIKQVPPMFSAKKVNGKKLYELARRGLEIERTPVTVEVHTKLLGYEYPYLDLHITCSKGTYVRSIAHDLGNMLGCGAHVVELQRSRSGSFCIEQCLDGALLEEPSVDVASHLQAVQECHCGNG